MDQYFFKLVYHESFFFSNVTNNIHSGSGTTAEIN